MLGVLIDEAYDTLVVDLRALQRAKDVHLDDLDQVEELQFAAFNAFKAAGKLENPIPITIGLPGHKDIASSLLEE